ncbi:hypothetical protein AGABI1DRAFT_132057 [Agaricus bisporus var. burnettii JB137-S8]|uniref:Transaldolase n=1 Tax=Agaricus bisporus var. burnettii (strain JB137-S8 / ATCC MYA-4627 / FGSC 10392) TaxID=597362 RepID=K5XM90_AGABU|nr:uncharacterized protein AGABI1DRAFT_132057 [Agaricus bisporus var. burnettii JB137-S8]EKM75665.1 hypothetical protein AGABI1DRAFT_132057 [Agaricus bisporus var. burnettii JB137-S8]
MATSLLHQLRSLLLIDVDSMDMRVSQRNTSDTEKFQDMTSNQALAYNEIIRPENAELVRQTINFIRDKDLDQDSDTFQMDVIDTLMILLAKKVLPYLNGNVHVQTSPSVAYDTEKTIAHAKKLVALFEEHGIPKNRVCIKIPATPESMLACQYLHKIGIQTLATCLFSLPQALAASQAGCKYVAPYFNELRVHFDKEVWKEYSNPAQEHPMSTVILSVIATFREIKSQTQVIPASIVTIDEIIALASFQPAHITVSGPLLDQLSSLPAVNEIKPTPLPASSVANNSLIGEDYLADGGSRLRDAIAADPEVQRKLTDALVIFGNCERKTKEFLSAVL